jgi:hypothetical protein
MNYTIGRNPNLSKWINWASLGLGGLIFFVNVHFSAAAMKVVAQNAGEVGFIPTAADDGLTGIAARYITAFAVSFACLLISGCFLHPNGLPTVFSELRNLEARGTSKVLGMAITIVAIGVLAYGGYWAYRYDLMTTMLAFGITNLWSVAAFPVWLNVVGPEFFFHGTHFYGRLIGGSSAAPPSMPPQAMSQATTSSPWKLFK